VFVITISVLTTERHARKTGPAAHSDTDNAMRNFGHATLVARALQRLPRRHDRMRRNSRIVFPEGVRQSTGRPPAKSQKNNRFRIALAARDCQPGSLKGQRERLHL
jgi:hypothetical protein